MSMQSRLLSRAIQFSEAGNKEDALRLLQAVIQQDPHNEAAWFCYVRTLATVDERIEALKQFLRVEPANRRAQEVLWMLWERKSSAALTKPRASERYRERYRAPFYVVLALFLVTLISSLIGIVHLRQVYLGLWVGRYDALLSQYNSLRQDHDGLAAQYNSLLDQHSRLQQDYDSLIAQHNSLLSQYNSLQQDYEYLLDEYSRFRSQAITPPYICVDGRTVHIAFFRTDQTVDFWEAPFESLERSIEMGLNSRGSSSFERAATLTLDNPSTGETYYVWDHRKFVNPSPFQQVMSDLYAELGSDDAFIRETWNIVAQLTAYSEEIEETPRYPLETFLAGGGDCEDTAILFASMIKAAPVDWEVYLVYMDIDNPLDPKDVNHVIVYINTGTQQYFIETTNDYEMQPFDNVRGWYYEVD